MRADGEVRFVRLSARLQRRVALAAAGLLLVLTVGMLSLLAFQIVMAGQQSQLSARAAKVQSAEERVAAYRESIDAVARDLETRQDVLDRLARGVLDRSDEADTAGAGPAAEGEVARKVGMAVPGAARLARVEERQLAQVSLLSRIARARAAKAEAAIRTFGLNPDNLAGAAQGGPLLPAGSIGQVDPRFGALAELVERMAALEDSLAFIPNAMPALVPMASSSYGYRRDPFTGGLAFHSGIDFPGAHGSAILAAADGTISFVGAKAGYGNVVEVTHAGGLMTRYAHLSRFGVRPGQKVSRGDRLAAMGSTGRSTGPHLHFEVRMGERALDPRRFLGRTTNVQ